MEVKLIWITPEAERFIAYIARVSNPSNQNNPDYAKLLRYCLNHKHFSIFEQAAFCVEIKTSRAISAQIIRHRSFCFQEFSARYAEVIDCENVDARRQDLKNRQSSHNDLSENDKNWFSEKYNYIKNISFNAYREALSRGIAKECARFLLPLSSSTTIYMTGNIRSWIHYIELRTEQGTQKEHRDIASAIKNIFINELPIISEALEWKHD